MNQREPFKIIGIVGLRGHGKTGTLIREVIPDYLRNRYGQFKFTAEEAAKNDTIKAGEPYIRIEVYDLEYNYNYQSFECYKDSKFPTEKKHLLKSLTKNPVPVISLKQVPGLKKGMVRVLPGPDEHSADFAENAMAEICYNKKIRNCLCVLEDTMRFLPGNNAMDKILKSICINTKQRSMDTVLMFHDFLDVPPQLFRWLDVLYLHKTENSIKVREKVIGEAKFNKIFAAEKEVNVHQNKFYQQKIILIA